MLTRLWTIGMKVADLDQELQFHRQLGNEIVLDEYIKTDTGEFRLPLIKMGDRFLHLMEETVYEQELNEPLSLGPAHLVYVSDKWDEDVANAIAAGGRQLIEPVEIEAEFGRRKLTFIQAPGGWNFEIFDMIEDRVADVAKYKSRLTGLWTCGTKVPDIDRMKLSNRVVKNFGCPSSEWPTNIFMSWTRQFMKMTWTKQSPMEYVIWSTQAPTLKQMLSSVSRPGPSLWEILPT
jgi:hypothetical protein